MTKYLNPKAITLVVINIILFAGMYSIEIATNHSLLINEHVHIVAEVIGAVIIILVAFMITIYKHDWEYNMSGFIIGFLLMGLFDLFHSFSPLGDRFVFLHSSAGIFGGIGIISTILMKKLNFTKLIKLKSLIIISIMAYIVGTLVFYFDQLIPVMVENNEFTNIAVVINIAAGIFFLLSSMFFYIQLINNDSKVNLLFFSSSLLMGISNITFKMSELWCATWWTWHVTRLIAYIIMFGFILILIEDNRKKLEQRNNEILEINKKLNEYTYIISHDLKEPIRSIRTFSEFILEDYEEQFDETGKDYFNRIILASNKMANMIDDLLILSRIGKKEIEFKNVALNDILKEIEFEMNASFRTNNVSLHYAELPTISCQPMWMKMVFSNLISNSIKYHDESKGYVEINVTITDDPKDKNKYLSTVSDNGIGIDKTQHEKVFGLFRRAYSKKDKEGSGAGLAIVKSIIQEHSGDIWIEDSSVGAGTKICFTIKKGA
jgi:signal transduction histidine kinase